MNSLNLTGHYKIDDLGGIHLQLIAHHNHVHRRRACPMWDHHNARHYWMPPSIRERFSPEQRDLTSWMDYTIPDRTVPGAQKIGD